MIKRTLPLLIASLLSSGAFSQESMPDWFLQEMQNDIGTWIADNADYKNEQERYETYQLTWDWSIKGQCLKGTLYGVHQGKKSPVFWEFRKFWDSQEGKPTVLQMGLNGTYGVGHTQKINEKETRLSQVFHAPNGLQYQEGHITTTQSDTLYIGTSYSISPDDQWEQRRTYTWVKAPEETINPDDQLSFFNTIEGIWEGMPSDTSFISVLHYQRKDKQHFVLVDNDLLSKKRKPFSHYEGTYFFNPHTSRIEFTTINQSEIHSGYCQVSSDTLFHYATINNQEGMVRAYTSAIVKIDDNTLAYYAAYGKDEKMPVLTFENALIYRRKE